MQSLSSLINQKIFSDLLSREIIKVPIVYFPVFKCSCVEVKDCKKIFDTMEKAKDFLLQKITNALFCSLVNFEDLTLDEQEEVSEEACDSFVSIFTLDPTLPTNKIYIVFRKFTYDEFDQITYLGNNKQIFDSFGDSLKGISKIELNVNFS